MLTVVQIHGERCHLLSATEYFVCDRYPPTRHLNRKDAQRSTWVIELFIAPAPALTHALTQIAVRTVTHSHPIKPPLVRVSKNLKDFNGRLSFHLICLEEDREAAQ